MEKGPFKTILSLWCAALGGAGFLFVLVGQQEHCDEQSRNNPGTAFDFLDIKLLCMFICETEKLITENIWWKKIVY